MVRARSEGKPVKKPVTPVVARVARTSKTSPNVKAALPGKPIAASLAATALIDWAEELALRVESNRAPLATPPPLEGDSLAGIVKRFALDEAEAAILALTAAVERSFALSRRLRALSGAQGLTVELVRALCAAAGLAGVDERLLPRGRLRRHALVRLPETRLVSGGDAIRIEVGLSPPMAPDAELDGVTIHEPQPQPPAERPAFVQRLGGKIPVVVALEPPSSGSELAIARAIADGTGRRVIAWAAHAADAERVQRLRRSADLDGAVLVVWGAAASLTCLLSPPAEHAEGTPIVVVIGGIVDEKQVHPPFTLRRDTVLADVTRAAPAPLTEMDRIRAMAQRDADRALGIIRPAPPPRIVVPGRIVDTPVRVERIEIAAAEPAPTTVPVAVPVPVPVTAPVAATAPVTVRVPVPVDASASVAVAASVPAAADDGARIEVAADAAPDLRARAAMKSPSAAQRIELLKSLAGMKTATVVAALRHNAKSEHAALRQVAETLMGQIFGPAWNRSRAIAPPVQPPSSDDGGRGPHGA